MSQGNLAVRVPAKKAEGDLGDLSETFNNMTEQLRSQRAELLAANAQIDSRRRFTEAVLSGVTAGRHRHRRRGARHHRQPHGDAAPRPRRALDRAPCRSPRCCRSSDRWSSAALRDDRPEHRDQISVNRGGRERTINVRVTTEGATDDVHGYVITLDDITDLVSAQRSSAWADVARRIAHEIKNPLTPIQLSAERLRRKFGKAIHDDREIFDQCTDTIIRQVGDIGRMVDEFSSFARMPKPAFEVRNLSEFDPRGGVPARGRPSRHRLQGRAARMSRSLGRFDARLISQAFTNIVKNGTEAIAALPAEKRAGAKITRLGQDRGREHRRRRRSTPASACRPRTATGCSSLT